MFDFSHLDPTQRTTWVELPEIGPNAAVEIRPATESNPLYFSNMLKRASGRARRIARMDRVSAEDSAQNRHEDRELYPKFVLIGWRNIYDTAGAAVPFNTQNAHELCAKLPDWIFDRIRMVAASPERFLPDDAGPEPDVKALVGN